MANATEHLYSTYPTVADGLTSFANGVNAAAQLDALYQEMPRQQVDLRLRQITESITRQRRMIRLLHIAHINYKDPLEAKIAGEFFSSVFPDPARAKLGVMELLMNAIEHGNLGITSSEKHELMLEGQWMPEIARRLMSPQYKDRNVHVYCLKTPKFTMMTVRDEGDGFNWQPYMDKHYQTPVKDLSGRGIAAAKFIAFDELGYSKRGNQVWAKQFTTP